MQGTPRCTAFARSARWSARWSTGLAKPHQHAPEGAKKGRVGHPRPEAAHELTQGLNGCKDLFGDDCGRYFVPPWKQVGRRVAVRFLAQGAIVGVSTYLPREGRHAQPDLVQINTISTRFTVRRHTGGSSARDADRGRLPNCCKTAAAGG